MTLRNKDIITELLVKAWTVQFKSNQISKLQIINTMVFQVMKKKSSKSSHVVRDKSVKVGQSNSTLQVRLDKWLWAARFSKTRAIARDLVQSGKVHYNGQRSKPSKIVEVGAVIKVPMGFDERVVTVKDVKDKRQSASIAQTLYLESEQSIAQREKNQQARKLSLFHSPRPDSRPDKKQRRQIIQFKHQ
jgi:ribosome-associated heat shock protein Hsp15